MADISIDQETADKFATSWNNVYDPSVYTKEQFLDWVSPWSEEDVRGKDVLELGCGSGALLFHMADFDPKSLTGVDLGDSIQAAEGLLGKRAKIEKGDITQTQDLLGRLGKQDCCYSIGVLHHLTNPEEGVETLKQMTKVGGSFHGWVYAHEGNAVVRYVVDPLRKLVNHLPWSVNKYGVALPLSVPFFLYGRLCKVLKKCFGENLPLPLFRYMLWISERDFNFHHHVAFDQLVTPMTHYITKERVESWLNDERVDPTSTYIVFRNGNGWKFGGKIAKSS
jgi:SAM-dependent methyltransferase